MLGGRRRRGANSGQFLREHHCEIGDGTGISLENVKSRVAGKARFRTSSGGALSVESWHGVL